MLDKITAILEEFQARDVKFLTLPESAIVEHMVVASGTSGRHLWTLCEKLCNAMRAEGIKTRTEGDASSDWIVLDLGEVVVHFLTPEKRSLYDLEALWEYRADDASTTHVEGGL